jgi:hypothetical protein
MRYRLHSHRNGLELLQKGEQFAAIWGEVEAILASLTERSVLVEFQSSKSSTKPTSISSSLSRLLNLEFNRLSWDSNVGVFSDVEYGGSNWRVDFAKGGITVEVAFNHAGNIAWNLIKPVLASEPNDVKQEINASVGVLITVTEEMKVLGGFDNAIGTFEKYVHYLRPMQQMQPTPLVVIGIAEPSSFHIEHVKVGSRKIGQVVIDH